MTPLLLRAQSRLRGRLDALEALLDAGEDAWAPYLDTLTAWIAVLAELRPERSGRLLTTRELAAQLAVSPKTILRKRAKGELTPAVVNGRHGRGALRWRSELGGSGTGGAR
jgi:hypothetical protein